MASKVDNSVTALAGLGAPGPYVTGSYADRHRSWLLAKTGKTSGSIADLQVAAGLPVRFVTQNTQVVLP